MSVLVGVDSGGTHTNVRIVARNKTSDVELHGSLSSNQSDAELAKTMKEIFSTILAKTLGRDVHVWIAAAGYSASTRSRIEQLLPRYAESVSGKVGVSNDAVAILLANDVETVVVVAGTGSVAMARRSTGEVLTLGGDEWVAGDYGSAFWLGLSGIRAAYRAFQRGGPETALLDRLLDHYSRIAHSANHEVATAVPAIVRSLAAKGSQVKRIVASFGQQVCDAALKGDEVSQRIVRAGAAELAASTATLYRKLNVTAGSRTIIPRIVVAGSLAYKSTFYLQAFRSELDLSLSDVRESLACNTIDVEVVLDGLRSAVSLAERLSLDEELPPLGSHHPYHILG